jgi:hypothetical protein
MFYVVFFYPLALTALLGPWSLLEFRNNFFLHGLTPWTIYKSVARPLPTHKRRIKSNTNIHASSGIRTHDYSVRASEDSSCFRPFGHRNRLSMVLLNIIRLRAVISMVCNDVMIEDNVIGELREFSNGWQFGRKEDWLWIPRIQRTATKVDNPQ